MQRVVLLLFAAVGTIFAGCQPASPPPVANVVALTAEAVPEDPSDAAWQAAPEYIAALIPQDLVEPRAMSPTTPEVRVKAIAGARQVAFRLQWADATQDDLSTPGRFTDACAVQMPVKPEPTVPAPQMGETGRPVEITFWTACWQATVNGRGDTIQDIYPRATADHYPFEAPALKKGSPDQHAMALRYAPARALGNRMAGPRQTAVQDLIAEGPGTLTPAPSTQSKGRAQRTPDGWAVVIVRARPQGFSLQSPSQVAFAVWEGGREEVGARKMRTGWIPLTLQEKAR